MYAGQGEGGSGGCAHTSANSSDSTNSAENMVAVVKNGRSPLPCVPDLCGIFMFFADPVMCDAVFFLKTPILQVPV